jgi:hypothetical protein
MEKREFILSELWMLTINAAFQRANVYKSHITESDRVVFKKQLKNYVNSISTTYVSNTIDHNKHIENIQSISAFSKKFSNILNNGKLNFGISQKLLNLHLKYLWCMDIIKIPPHFPVDRIIQLELKINTPYPWTKMIDENDYLKIIDIAEKALSKELENLAELELQLFNRRGEDSSEIIIAESRKDEESVSWEDVKKRLKKKGRI